MKIVNYSIPNECLIEFDDSVDHKYDYEILDEEINEINKEKIKLKEEFAKLENKILEDQKILLELKEKIDNLN